MDFRERERKWQEEWEKAGIFQAEPDGRPKFYLTVAYPYVSGPMHIGHARTYTIPDVIARYKRMRGYNVLFPMAFHFTGTPIVGASKRVARREPGYIELLTKRYGVPQELLPQLEDPKYFGTYFAEISDLSYKKGMKWLGLSIDWRRDFTTVDPPYSKFITWQYHKLMEAGLIVKGKHPVRWCPRDGNPVTDHDLLEGEEAEVLEFTLLKYKQEGRIFPAATLRPETVFGVTNLWLNPNVRYVEVEVNGEKWVVSEQAVPKLAEQGYRVGEARPFQVKFGSEVEVPLIGRKVPILPATFVDPENATGVVGSVPSHAPYDYVALEELKSRGEELKEWGVKVESLQPISLIEVEGYGEFPAAEEVERLGIKGQLDPKLEEATSRVYRTEFAKGRMRNWIPVYGGKMVSEAKNLVKQDLLSRGEAALMYEFSLKPVRCRCGSPVVIKVVEDQWFLNYADEEWKEKAREVLAKMELIPPESRAQYEHTIGWLREWPCTRKVGMGTRAPWDPAWIIESLSDSTVYMAYYTFSHLLKQVDPEKLGDEIFDFVFYGKGNPQELSRSSGLPVELLERMKREFEYWYPLDYRMSASELIPNHLTFFIFHHALLFPHRLPKGIVCFGMAILEGQKMSSSKGNLVEVNKAVQEYGADAVRLYLTSSSEPWQDFNWRKTEAESMLRMLERFHSLCEEILSLPLSSLPHGTPERWLLSRLQRRVEEATQALERFETRRALQHSFFSLMQEVRKYLSWRGEEARGEVLRKVLHTWIRLLAPFIPHLCEEIWNKMGEKGFVSLAPWPQVEEGLKDPEAEFVEEFLSSVVEDVGKIVKVVKVKPKLVCLYTPSGWKREAGKMIVEKLLEGKTDRGELLRHLEERMGKPKAELAPFLAKVLEETKDSPIEKLTLLSKVDEYQILKENSAYLQRLLGAEVKVFREDDPEIYDPKGRSKGALPFRPAIYVE
ncbi:MAG: leucine--tRNA ligase [Candidatus Hadarchaeales archaeon]